MQLGVSDRNNQHNQWVCLKNKLDHSVKVQVLVFSPEHASKFDSWHSHIFIDSEPEAAEDGWTLKISKKTRNSKKNSGSRADETLEKSSLDTQVRRK